MKKQFVSPEIRVIKAQTVGLICGSDDRPAQLTSTTFLKVTANNVSDNWN